LDQRFGQNFLNPAKINASTSDSTGGGIGILAVSALAVDVEPDRNESSIARL